MRKYTSILVFLFSFVAFAGFVPAEDFSTDIVYTVDVDYVDAAELVDVQPMVATTISSDVDVGTQEQNYKAYITLTTEETGILEIENKYKQLDYRPILFYSSITTEPPVITDRLLC